MKKHYQEIVDDVIGPYSQHRTLRTLFDPNSSEWVETTIDQKIQLLKSILGSKKITLHQLLMEYKYFYTNELSGKAYVAKSIEDGLAILLENSLNSNNL
jgi:hypothetical protein